MIPSAWNIWRATALIGGHILFSEDGYDALDDSGCHPDLDTYWCVAELALQCWLGVRSRRPGGYDSYNRDHSGIVRQNLAVDRVNDSHVVSRVGWGGPHQRGRQWFCSKQIPRVIRAYVPAAAAQRGWRCGSVHTMNFDGRFLPFCGRRSSFCFCRISPLRNVVGTKQFHSKDMNFDVLAHFSNRRKTCSDVFLQALRAVHQKHPTAPTLACQSFRTKGALS
jgi:hypothetical protein